MAEKKEAKKIEKISKHGLVFEQETIKSDQIKNEYEYNVKVVEKEFKIEIKFDNSRQKYQCWLTANDKRMSLSFFPSFNNAKESAYQTITYMTGGQIKNSTNGVGD